MGQKGASVSNGSAAGFVSIADRVAEFARTKPGRRAVVCDGHALTFAALAAKARACAARLQALGLEPKGARRVGILAQNSLDFAVVAVACQMAGVVVVPLPGLVAPDAQARMMEDAAVGVLFHDEHHAAQAAAARALAATGTNFTTVLIGLGAADAPDAKGALDRWLDDAAPFHKPQVAGDWPSDLIYSSGTTGQPKGIMQSCEGRVATCTGLGPLELRDGIHLFNTVGLYSNFGLGGLLVTLWWGGTFFMMRKFSGADLVALLEQEAIDLVWVAPATLLRTMEAPGFATAAARRPCVKFCAGAPLSVAQKQAVLTSWPGPFFDMYGQSETGTVSLLPVHAVPGDKRGSVGRPLPSVAVHILDEDGCTLPDGVAGEIAARTTTLMSFYHRRDDANAAVYWQDEAGRRFVRTGDMGWLDGDGFLWLCDRKKDMIISGGFNIYPADIERVLLDHPAVFEAAVVGFPSARWGESPVAFVTLREPAAGGADELRDWVNARVGAVQRLAAVRILPELPNGTMGKILKRELRDVYAGPIGMLP